MLGRGLLVHGDGQHTSPKVSESPPLPMLSPARTSPPALCNGDMISSDMKISASSHPFLCAIIIRPNW